jgi:hypothetical protein
MLSELTAAQLSEQLAFDALEPAGGLRDDMRIAILVCAVINSNPYRDGWPVKPSDVFRTLKTEEDKPQSQNVHAIVAQRRRWIEAHNAAIRAGTMRRRPSRGG